MDSCSLKRRRHRETAYSECSLKPHREGYFRETVFSEVVGWDVLALSATHGPALPDRPGTSTGHRPVTVWSGFGGLALAVRWVWKGCGIDQISGHHAFEEVCGLWGEVNGLFQDGK